jgi:Holliday junction resolvasome RuvABC ATP-dependent DNA helicase subunit
VNVSGRNPRIMIKTFLNNLEIHYSNKKEELLERSDEELIENIDRIHGIRGGLDKVSRQYLDTLKELGGRSSINLLSAAANLDINTIRYTVEPALLYKKLIRITNKGRELVEGIKL